MFLDLTQLWMDSNITEFQVDFLNSLLDIWLSFVQKPCIGLRKDVLSLKIVLWVKNTNEAYSPSESQLCLLTVYTLSRSVLLLPVHRLTEGISPFQLNLLYLAKISISQSSCCCQSWKLFLSLLLSAVISIKWMQPSCTPSTSSPHHIQPSGPSAESCFTSPPDFQHQPEITPQNNVTVGS